MTTAGTLGNGMQKSYALWLILGPSGAGKSSFGKWLAAHRSWFHLEVDRSDGDGIDLNNLRPEWDKFWRGYNARPLRKTLHSRCLKVKKKRCVLTFPSNLVLGLDHIAAAREEGIEIIYLYGSAAHCITGFLKREERAGRSLGLDHWLTNNRVQYLRISEPSFAVNRIHVFTDKGSRRAHRKIFELLLKGQRDGKPSGG